MNWKFTAVYSNKDEAGKNIARNLKALSSMSDIPIIDLIIGIEKDIVDAENIDRQIVDKQTDADFIIFISKHKSQQYNKTLSIHAPGNWHEAELGGQSKKVCLTSSFFLKSLFIELNKQNSQAENSSYQVTLEVTHHGPYIEKPCCFIEIGSSENEWKDGNAGKIIAQTLIETVKSWKKNEKNGAKESEEKKWIPAIGIGGNHYCYNFNKIQLNSVYAISHIIPRYSLPLNEDMVREAIEKTIEKPELALLDWKGLGKAEERKQAIEILEKARVKYERTGRVEK